MLILQLTIETMELMNIELILKLWFFKNLCKIWRPTNDIKIGILIFFFYIYWKLYFYDQKP